MAPVNSLSGEASDEAARLREHGVVRLRADNPGPFTLSGTNTWLVGSGPAYVIDPGPLLPGISSASSAPWTREAGSVASPSPTITPTTARRCRPCANASPRRWPPREAELDVRLDAGVRFGGLEAIATPGHAPDHMAFAFGRTCFTGDAVLGEGSVFVSPDPGALAGYLRRAHPPARPRLRGVVPWSRAAGVRSRARIDGYLEHRADRERRLLDALAEGRRSVDDVLDAAWSEVPAGLRGAATLTLAAHLDKLDDEGRLPPGVERPSW